MKPIKIIPSEHDEQVRVIMWSETQWRVWPELKWLFAIPNGGNRSKGVAGKLRAEGVRAGVSDLMLPSPRAQYAGLFIEMKSLTGKLTPDQRVFLSAMAAQGYATAICYGADEAIETLLTYLKQPYPNK